MNFLSEEEIKNYPSKVAKPYSQLQESSDQRAIHKSLLDLGEGLLDYLIAFMFGEYKKTNNVNESIETEFYRKYRE